MVEKRWGMVGKGGEMVEKWWGNGGEKVGKGGERWGNGGEKMVGKKWWGKNLTNPASKKTRLLILSMHAAKYFFCKGQYLRACWKFSN